MHHDPQAAQAHQQALEGAALRHFRPTPRQLPTGARIAIVEAVITAALAGFCAFYVAAYLVGA